MRVRKLAAAVAALAVAAAVAVWVVVPAMAQTPTATPDLETAAPGGGHGRGSGFGLRFGGDSVEEFDAQAEALGLTPTKLFEQLHDGMTLSEIAEAQGVDLQTVQDSVSALRTQATKDAIAQAVADGTMPQAQADWLLEGIENGYLNDLGRIGGFGGRMGIGGPDRGPGAPQLEAGQQQGTQS